MIERDEIDAKAEEFEITTSNVQRDYVFGWLLFAIYNNDYLSPRLVLKGGNCFRKAYFPNTRFSSDLDFSTTEALDLARFSSEIENCCNLACDVSLRPAALAGQGGFDRGFVNEDNAVCEPVLALLSYPCAASLGGDQRLFL